MSHRDPDWLPAPLEYAREPAAEVDAVDAVSHFHKCCACKQPCDLRERLDHPGRESACCSTAWYRVDFTSMELLLKSRDAAFDGDYDMAELYVHAAMRVRPAERESNRRAA
jgi:hypothetical protein